MKTKITLFKLTIIGVLFISSTSLLKAQNNAVNPTAAANTFSVFTSEDAIAIKTESEGSWAIGGDFILDGVFNIYGGVNSYNGDSNETALVVNGKISYVSGKLGVLENNHIKIGDLSSSTVFQIDNNNSTINTRLTSAGGNINDTTRIDLSINQPTTSITGDSEINFTEAFVEFQSISTCIGVENTNVTWDASEYNDGKLLVDLTQNQVNIINLSVAEFNGLSEIIFNSVVPSATAPFIINITDLNNAPNIATINSWPNVVDTPLDYARYMLYNFPNITSTINYNGGAQIYGTIYAPKARFNNRSNSNIDGQIIAKSFEQNSGEVHPYIFSAQVNCFSTQVEICDGIDNNGNGQIDEGFSDIDNDGVSDCIDNCPQVPNPNQEECGPDE